MAVVANAIRSSAGREIRRAIRGAPFAGCYYLEVSASPGVTSPYNLSFAATWTDRLG
jgi:hypothetical protein